MSKEEMATEKIGDYQPVTQPLIATLFIEDYFACYFEIVGGNKMKILHGIDRKFWFRGR